jgi:adenylate cyclase
MSNGNFFTELKRRNVYKVAITYAVVAWLLIEIASIIITASEAAGWLLTAFVVLLAIGFVLAVIISWSFEATPEGLKRTENVPVDAVLPTWSKRKYASFLVVVAALAAALLAFQLLHSKSATAESKAQPPAESLTKP